MGLMGLMGSVNPSTPSTPFGPIDLNGSVQLGLTCTFKSIGFGPVQLDLLTVWLDLGLKSDQAGPLTTLPRTLPRLLTTNSYINTFTNNIVPSQIFFITPTMT